MLIASSLYDILLRKRSRNVLLTDSRKKPVLEIQARSDSKEKFSCVALKHRYAE